jgi:hypothetical protein
MNAKVIAVAFILVMFAPAVFALTIDETLNMTSGKPATVIPTQDDRMLAAQTAQEIRAAKDDIISAVNAYNDENFQIFDARMDEFLKDTKTKVALGAIGASLVANALAAYLVMRTMKRYSYETYQQKLIGKMQEEAREKDNQIAGMQQMQQPDWAPQQPQNTMGMVYGQSQASEMSQMNSWQGQPAYFGSWQSPIDVKPEYSHRPAGYEHIDDPMQSPQWDPRGQ